MKFSRGFAFISLAIVLVLLVAFVGLGIYTIRLDNVVRAKFEGKRWEIPAKVFARPLEIFNGANVTKSNLTQELKLLNYKKTDVYESPGTYVDKGNKVYIHTRGFDFGDSNEPEQVLEVTLGQSQILDVRSTQQTGTGIARLEPIPVGGIYPRHNEDRVLIQLSSVPQPL
ncbi:MAG: penicillin-binding protein 1B, partial [Flavobacterium sp.]